VPTVFLRPLPPREPRRRLAFVAVSVSATAASGAVVVSGTSVTGAAASIGACSRSGFRRRNHLNGNSNPLVRRARAFASRSSGADDRAVRKQTRCANCQGNEHLRPRVPPDPASRVPAPGKLSSDDGPIVALERRGGGSECRRSEKTTEVTTG